MPNSSKGIRNAEWSPDELLTIRRMIRHGASPSEVKTAIGSQMTTDAIRDRARRYGMRFTNPRSAHAGTSKLSIPDCVRS